MLRIPVPSWCPQGVSVNRFVRKFPYRLELLQVRQSTSNGMSTFLEETYKRPQKSDLRTVPGIGPKNEALLQLQQVVDLQSLQQLFSSQCNRNADEMRKWLHDTAGIKNKRHCASIVAYLSDETETGTTCSAASSRMTLAIEGNISAGKSTFLRMLSEECARLDQIVEIVPEPVDKWQCVGDSHINMLDLFYQQPDRFAYTFQNYVFVTRVVQLQERDSRARVKPLRLLERSVFSDRMVFVRAVHEAKWLTDDELEIYDSWFDPVVNYFPGLVPDGFIYLRAGPETCHRRMTLRNRNEETGIELDYLANLHQKHEDWLMAGVSTSQINGCMGGANGAFNGLHVGDSGRGDVGQNDAGGSRPNNRFKSFESPPRNIICPEPASISGQVKFLQGPGVHPILHNTPALILDCDTDIDVVNDKEAKLHYARQVREYYKWVSEFRQQHSSSSSSSSHMRSGGSANGNGRSPMDLKELQLL